MTHLISNCECESGKSKFGEKFRGFQAIRNWDEGNGKVIKFNGSKTFAVILSQFLYDEKLKTTHYILLFQFTERPSLKNLYNENLHFELNLFYKLFLYR